MTFTTIDGKRIETSQPWRTDYTNLPNNRPAYFVVVYVTEGVYGSYEVDRGEYDRLVAITLRERE